MSGDAIDRRFSWTRDARGAALGIADGARERLAALGLDAFEPLFAHEAPFLDRNKRRDVVAIDAPGGRLYRKRQHGIKPRDRWRARLRGRGLRSHAREEARHLMQLDALGFRVPALAALGEAPDDRALLVLEELDGVALDAWLDAGRDAHAAADAVRALCRRLLDGGVFWPDLDARHVFLRAERDGLDPGVLDVQRLAIRRRVVGRARAKMHARMSGSLPEGSPVAAAVDEAFAR